MFKSKPTLMSRREALAAVAGAAGVLGITGLYGGVLTASPGTAKMTLGCGTVVFRQRPLKEALERIRRAGYDYIETQAVGPWCPHVDVSRDDPQSFRDLVRSVGFSGVTGLWSSHGAIIPDPESVEGITRTIRWARQAGIPMVHAGDGRKPDTMSEQEALKILRERLSKILEVAEECRVHLLIEPHGTFSMTAEGLNKIMGVSASRWLGINYDTANVHHVTLPPTSDDGVPWTLVGQRQDEVTTLKAVVNHVRHVHMKDSVGSKCVTLGKGTVNLRGCIAVLKSHGYQGVLSLETEGDLGVDEAQGMIEASRTYLQEALAGG
jgi:sugar phosphate isomerase/epimerase